MFAAHADPVRLRHVASLPRPGGNITGLSMMFTEIVEKQLEILTETVPHAPRLGVLFAPITPSHAPALQAIETASQKLGVAVHKVPVRTAEDFEGAFTMMAQERVGGFLALGSPLITSQRALLAELGLKHRLPGMFANEDIMEAGGLMSYAPDLRDLTRRAATYIDKILKGVKPAGLPVEQATKYRLVINLKPAEALGLTVPPSILARADKVIE